MKNFKRIAVLLVALLVAMSVLLVMASCGGDDTDASSSQGGQSSAADSSSQGGQSSTVDSSTDASSNNGFTDNSGSVNSSTAGSNDGGDNSSNNSSAGSENTGDKPDNPPADNPNLVKVTVLNQLGKPVKGAVIQICQGETCFNKPIVTDSTGVGTREYTLGTGTLKAKVNEVDGMEDFVSFDDYIYFEPGARELTIYIQKVSVNVFDDKENAVEGAVVQLYQGEVELDSTIITDAEGTAYAFVALNGNGFSARVTEILLGSGYDIPKEATEFESGEYEATIEVKKNASYSVRVSTMFGEAVVGAKVKLYSGKIFEDVATTNENGIVTFENLKEGEYSVEISIVSPAYQVIGAQDDGRFYFTEGATALEVNVLNFDEITYTVSVSNGAEGSVIDILNLDNEIIATIETDAEGKATFVAPNSYYVAVLRTEGEYAEPAYFVKDDDAVGEIKVTNKTAGTSKDAPIILVGEFHMPINAEQIIWFALPNANKKTVTVISESGVAVKLGDDLDYISDGETAFVTDMFLASKGETVVISIKSSVAQQITVKSNAPGTHGEPIDLSGELSDTGVREIVSIEADTKVYYSYTAEKDGAICVEVNGVTVNFNENDMGLDLGDGRWIYPVFEGETVLISFSNYETVDAEVVFTYGDVKIDYTVLVNLDGISPEGIVAILYAYVDGDLTEVARKAADSQGICVFENISYASNYIVKVEKSPDGYEPVYEGVEFLIYNFANYALTPIKTGEPEAPFEFDTTNELKENVSVPQDGTVWYTLYVRPSMESKFYIVAKSGNALIKVYNEDTNGDGVINGEDTPIGVSVTVNGESSYVFEANNMVYTIAVSTIDGSAEEIEIVYASQNLPEGSNEETAIEITEAGSYTAVVDGMAYYVFAGNEGCRLTITLTGDATLKIVHRANEGSTLEDAENNTYTVDTEGTWIYFAIAAENAGSYEFSVTVE